MSECIGCGTRLSDTTNSAYCEACMASHVVINSHPETPGTEVDHCGCEYEEPLPEWKYCPHCGERLA